ncbi:MAG: phosphonopyruvate decarboxylase [Burkholderiales bacterium]|nr:MAG: phosphonopyruvate decarboxylase [Burkholderiales bacterium]
MDTVHSEPGDWRDQVFEMIRRGQVRQLCYVPDAGHSRLIGRAHEAEEIDAYPLTTEEEGVAACAGAWLGGQRAILLMQSSGVGNCVNMLGLVANCRFPLVMLVTMRGEWAEFNPWQVPMARATRGALELMGVSVRRVDDPAQAAEEVRAALDDAFLADQAVAVLFSQRMLGRKSWER